MEYVLRWVEKMSDQFHCHCFSIKPKNIEICKNSLLNIGFTEQLGGEEDHGQAFGLVK